MQGGESASKEAFSKIEKLSGKKSNIEKSLPILKLSENNFLEDFNLLSRGRAFCSNSGRPYELKYNEMITYFSFNYESQSGFDTIWLEIMLEFDSIYIKYMQSKNKNTNGKKKF